MENLLNIENLNEIEKQQLKKIIIPYGFIDDRDEMMDLYNQLSENGSKCLIELVGYNALTSNFINKFKNIKYVIPPYSFDYYSFYMTIFKSNKLTEIALNSDIFYKNLNDNFKVEDVFQKLIDSELKKLFINKLFNFIIGHYKQFSKSFKLFIKENISDDKIIDYLKNNGMVDEVLNAFAILSSDTQVIVYNSDWFREKVDLDLLINQEFILANSCESIINDLSKRVVFSNIFTDLYHDSYNPLFLKLFLDKYDFESILNSQLAYIFIMTDKIYDSLGEDYQEKLYKLICNLSTLDYLEIYFKYYISFKGQSTKLKKIMFDRVKIILENNLITCEISSKIIKSNDKELLDLIINHISKEDLLILSIRNEYICNYVLNILKDDATYFKGIKISNNMKFYISKDIDNNLLNKYLSIFNYLDKEQYNLYYIPLFIEKDSNIQNIYKQDIINNPNSLIKLSDLKYVLSDIDNILDKIDIEKLMYLIFYQCGNIKDIVDIIKINIKKRENEILDYINSNKFEYIEDLNIPNFDRIIYLINDKEKFIKLITNSDFLCFIFNDTRISSLNDIILEQLTTIYNNEYNINFPYFFDDQTNYQKKFISSLNFDVIINYICSNCKFDNINSKKYRPYIDFICMKIDNDINILFNNINTIIMIENLLLYLPNNYKEKIKNYIDEKYNLYIKQYNYLGNFLKTYSDKANFISAIEAGLINDNNITVINKLLEKNIYLFNSMDFNLLKEDIKKMGFHFIEKTSRYPRIANKIYQIYSNDLNKFNLIVHLSNKLIKENTENIYDQKIEIIINYLFANNINIDFEINDKLLTNIENYILENSNGISKFSNKGIKNYTFERNKILDDLINNSIDIVSLKEYIYERYFWLSSSDVNNFLISYAFNFNSVLEFCDNDLPKQYINYIKIIKDINDVVELKQILSKLPEFNLSDFMIIKGVMINAYNKSIIHDMNGRQSGNSVNININGEDIKVTELTSNFCVFAHSTCAYGIMPIINDDYYDSWNYNPNTSNNGICTFLMTEYNYGTPSVTDTGVIFGFIQKDEGISLIAPYDLRTVNAGYNIKTTLKPFFGRISTISQYIRHTHSEATIKRRITDEDNHSSIRQPNCIVIFEDMDENIKKNSLKAYQDFKKHGINLDIYYIDRKKLAINSSKILNNMMKEYLINFDLDLLGKIINIYECNICSSTFLGNSRSESIHLYDENELFHTKELTDILNYTIDMLDTSHDLELLEQFIQVMEIEQFKFDLIYDFNKRRSNKFNLYTEDMKRRINKLKDFTYKHI